jgi:hypothetical protein
MKFLSPFAKAALFALTIVGGSIAVTTNGGTYLIASSNDGNLLATLRTDTIGKFVTVEHATAGDLAQQGKYHVLSRVVRNQLCLVKWKIELVDTDVIIKKVGLDLYLSYTGQPELNAPVVGSPEQRAWALTPSDIPTHFL